MGLQRGEGGLPLSAAELSRRGLTAAGLLCEGVFAPFSGTFYILATSQGLY